MIVSVLGEPYSFHHVAAMQLWDREIQYRHLRDFDQLIRSVQDAEADYAVIAVENTIAGDVPGNYPRVAGSGLRICGELYLHLDMHLAAKQQIPIQELHSVISHPMALKETAPFFQPYPHIRLLPADSTSTAAKFVSEEKDPGLAVIANSAAIRFFNLQIISKNIDNLPNNVTRFLILSKNSPNPDATGKPIKASLLLVGKVDEELAPFVQLGRTLPDGRLYIECQHTDPEVLRHITERLITGEAKGILLGMYPIGITASGN